MKSRVLQDLFVALVLTVAASTVLIGCDDDTVTVADLPPAIPTGVNTITGDLEVTVFWNPVRSDDVRGYGVYRSFTVDGAYERIGETLGVESTSFVDTDVANGTTYFYAVDAFSFSGRESELSFEDAFDTPRPESNVLETVLVGEAIDFSAYRTSGFIQPSTSPTVDIQFRRVGNDLHAVGTTIASQPNDIQDAGYTESMDDITWAPDAGWSVSANGVALIEGHTYVVWTWDNFYAKFRVAEILTDLSNVPSGARIEWAYQVDLGNPELKAHFASVTSAPADLKEESS